MINKCYRYEKLLYKDSLFNKSIDATYIINLEDNGRLDYIMKQLIKYHPTNIVYIVFNKGYKKCIKADFIINPPYDLVDANFNIFKHAKNNNYNNILILEDDFIFDSEIKSDFHIDNINNFLSNKKETSFQYYIGTIPGLILPFNFYNYRLIKSHGTHCVIFSKKMREKILTFKQKNITDWDDFTGKFINNRYLYYKPMCYQLFTDTENSKYWGSNDKGIHKIITDICNVFLRKIYNLLKLNKQVNPGYKFFYNFSKLLILFILFILSNLL